MANVSSAFTRDPVTFLGAHILLVNTGNITKGVKRFVMEEQDRDTSLAVLRLANDEDVDTFAGYYLPYEDNSTKSVQLGNMADFMFTQPMTGCSFVIDNKWYAPKVSHLNYQTPQQTIDQAEIDRNIVRKHGAPTTAWIVANYFTLRKADYVPVGQDSQMHRTIVFGVRGWLGWTVYSVKDGAKPNRIN